MVLSTIGAPLPSDVAFNAPNYWLRISGADIPIGVRQLVTSIEYESVEGYADMLKFTVKNPRYIAPRFQPQIGSLGIGAIGGGPGGVLQLEDSKIFQVGNEVDLGMGYGAAIQHVGRAIIRRVTPNFPQGAMPTITITAYTKDVQMMDNAPEEPNGDATVVAPRGKKKKKAKAGRAFVNVKYSEAVRDRASDYGFALDVDDTLGAPSDFIQKVGLSDYDFVRGLANLTGYVFWVDGDQDGTWTLHFKNPDRLRPADLWPGKTNDPRKYTFKYDFGDLSTLLSFEPEVVIQNAHTKLRVRMKDIWTGGVFEATFDENDFNPTDVLAEVLGPGDPLRGLFETDLRAAGLHMADNVVDRAHTSASAVKLYIGEFSVDLLANRTFETEADLVIWARQWYRRNRENFILGSGKIIGVETLRARQIHALEGIGTAYSGDYQLTRVRHQMGANGYTIDFTAHKRVPASVQE